MYQNLQYEVEIILSPSISPVYVAAQNLLMPVTNMTTTQLYDTASYYGYHLIKFISQYFE
jgi:hypothetical protein